METTISAPQPASFLRSSWSNSALLAGLALLAAYRLVVMIDVEWFRAFPYWLLFTVLGVVPVIFALIFPLATRQQEPPTEFRFPTIGFLMREGAVAVLVMFGCYFALFVMAFIAALISPDVLEYLESTDVFQNTMPTPLMYAFLVLMTTVGPLAEEFFFRGFLFNAFRKRVPVSIAVVSSSLIFGFAHSIALWHSIFASLLGIVLALVYWWRKTIIAPLLVHLGINTVAAAMIFVSMQMYADAPAIGVFPQQRATECLIGGVHPGSPADVAGLLPGDTIVQVGDYAVTNFQELIDAIQMYEPGDVVDVYLIRDGIELQTTVELKSRRELMPP